MKKSNAQQTIETLSHMRNDWNGVNPVTKVIPDKRKSAKAKSKDKEARAARYEN